MQDFLFDDLVIGVPPNYSIIHLIYKAIVKLTIALLHFNCIAKQKKCCYNVDC